MASDPGVIVAYGAASAPSGWLLCDGSAVSQATYAALYAAIGTDFGVDTGGNFTLPDYRGRFALGKSASGTGSTIGETGGALDHTHTGPSHTHAVDQPAAHDAHTVTQPSSHGTLTHTGAAIADHSVLTHTGAVVAAHSIQEANNHSTHTSDGGHTHDAHLHGARSGNFVTRMTQTAAHTSDGAHAHDAHSNHTGTTIDAGAAHSVTQASNHAADTHTISAQATSHGTLTHSGTTVTAAHSHTGMATQADGTGASGGANPPFQVVTFIIATGTTAIPVGAITDFGGTSVPTGHVLCDGASYDTTTEADLFTVIGYNFGGSGANFNVPDLRDRHVLGKAAAGTGSAIGATGGAVDHVHAGPSHTHTVTQADAHGSHTIGQATSHGTLTHTGTTITNHAALSHAGLALGNHTVGQPSAHATHASGGAHTHNQHSVTTNNGWSSGTDTSGWATSPVTHSSDGGHTHDAHPAHTGQALDAHTVSAQNSDHAAQSHSALITEAASHGTLDHTGADLDAHPAHSGGATDASGTGDTTAGDAPFLTVNFVIKKAVSPVPLGSGFMLGSMAVPALALACDGASYLQADYPYLFAIIGTTFGSADGTHFNVPDLRGRIPRGKSGSTALNDSGGSRDHTHDGPLHSHGVTQPSAHSDHTPTQPASHGTLTHSGFALSAHAALSHSGLTISNHTPTQAAGHGTHAANATHTHDAHASSTKADVGGTTEYTKISTHSSDGGHTHDAHSAHAGWRPGDHSITSAGDDHGSRSHTVSAQPDSHGTLTHSGFAVDAHSAHSGFATYDDGDGAMGTANPAYITVNYAIWAIGSDRSGTSTATGGGVATLTQTTDRQPSETFTGGGVAAITQTTDRQASEDLTGGGVFDSGGSKGGMGTVHLSDGGGTGAAGTTSFGWAA